MNRRERITSLLVIGTALVAPREEKPWEERRKAYLNNLAVQAGADVDTVLTSAQQSMLAKVVRARRIAAAKEA